MLQELSETARGVVLGCRAVETHALAAGGWQASERQRRGRAGRCQPGVAFHMYSTLRSSNLAEYQLPELKRCPLDELCLQVKLLEGASAVSDVREFLHKAVEPPVDKAVSQAVSLLQVRVL